MNSAENADRKWTERPSADATGIAENESMFRLLFERSADAITLQDPLTGAFLDVNAASIRMTGAPDKAALLGSNPVQISPERQPDGSLSAEKVKEVIRRALEQGSHRFEWVLNRFDGTQLPVEMVLTLIHGGERPLLLSVARDITERKRTEAELRDNQQLLVSVVDNISEAIYRTGPRHELIFANRAYLSMSGYDSIEEIKQVPREKLYANPAERGRLLGLLSRDGLFRNQEIEYLRRDGKHWWGLTNSIAVRDPQTGQVLYHVGSVADITERKQAADEIQKLNATLERRIAERTAELTASEARLRTIVDHAPEAIVVFEGDTGRFLSCNENAARLYGLSRDELLKLHPADVSPEFQPDGIPSTEAARAKIQQALAGEVPVFEWTHKHSSGRLIPCEVRLVRLPAEGRNLVRGSVIDNTERKRAEQALRDSEQKHRALFEATSQGVMLHDDKQILEVNPAAVRIMNCTSASELIGKHPGDLSPPMQPHGESSAAAAGRHITECMERGSTRFEWMSCDARGKLIPLEVILTRVDIGGRPLIQAVIIDIAERKAAEEALRKSEEKFKQLYELSPLGMAQVNWDGSFVQVNSAFANLIGYTREEIAQLTYWEVTPREYEPAELAVLDQLRRTGRFGPHEKEYFHKDGQRVPVVLNGMLVTAADGKSQLWGIVENITERKRAEAELHKAIAREKELGQLKSSFVSMVSHEFRTPLGIIQSSAEILSDYFERLEVDERREQLQSIVKNTRRMAEMMEEILALSRLDAGKMIFNPEPFNLSSFCRRVVDEVLSATNRRCVIELSLAAIPSEARGDERLLGHIFTNLLNNAVKYSERGATVRFAVERDGPDAVCLIRDQGIGISPDDQQKLFNAFQRGDNVGDRPGTGLGLVLVKRCLELHGGQVRIESKVGAGTTVTVRFPVFADSHEQKS